MRVAVTTVNGVRLMVRPRLRAPDLARILLMGERFLSLVWTG
jgi:hypothetical protein